MLLARILVPCDFSDTCMRALDSAVDLAKRYQAELLLLHVIAPEPVIPAYPSAPEPTLADQEAAARRTLELAAATARKLGVLSVETRVVLGTPPAEILAAIRSDAIDLVVMGTHGRTGLDLLLVGSVANKVVRKSPCPVLTVPPCPSAAAPPPPPA
jgi:nucleotide-binding universal stress UspA family protein